MGSGYRGYINTKGAEKRLKPAGLMSELERSGVKYTKEDVLMVTKNYDGKLMWLEKGNERAGFKHIKQRHENDFSNPKEIPLLLTEVLKLRPIKKLSRNNGRDLSDVFLYKKDKKLYLVAYGNNGYIVSFYPVDDKRFKMRGDK